MKAGGEEGTCLMPSTELVCVQGQLAAGGGRGMLQAWKPWMCNFMKWSTGESDLPTPCRMSRDVPLNVSPAPARSPPGIAPVPPLALNLSAISTGDPQVAPWRELYAF